MMENLDVRIKKAMTAGREAMRGMLGDPSDKVVLALLSNRNITEEELCALAKRRDLPGEVLGAVAGIKLSDEGYRVMVVLVNNPKTPRRVALGLVRKLRLRDMAYVTRNKALPTELRQAAAGMLKEKLPGIPQGMKVTLARQVSEEVVRTFLLEDDEELARACFDNPRMKEAVVLWALNHERVPGCVVTFIAHSPRWSALHSVRFALIRNPKTPVEKAMGLARGLKSQDQRLLYNDPVVPAAVKVQLEIELETKGQPLSPPREEGRVIGIPPEEPGEP